MLGFVCGSLIAGVVAEVENLGVHPAARKAGVGRALLRALMAEAGCESGTPCELEVREGNGPALALYAQLGFEVVGRRLVLVGVVGVGWFWLVVGLSHKMPRCLR